MSSKSLPARVAPYAICVFVALFSLPAWTQGDPQEAVSLLSMVLFSFVGGLILNLMPCVFPVLALKAFGFVRTAGENKKDRLLHVGAYTAGIVAPWSRLPA